MKGGILFTFFSCIDGTTSDEVETECSLNCAGNHRFIGRGHLICPLLSTGDVIMEWD